MTLSFVSIVTLSRSVRLKYLSHGFGIVTAKLLPTRIIFLVCSWGKVKTSVRTYLFQPSWVFG